MTLKTRMRYLIDISNQCCSWWKCLCTDLGKQIFKAVKIRLLQQNELIAELWL